MLRLIEGSVSGQVNCLIAEQVHFEFVEHDRRVQEEASKNLVALLKQVARVNEIVSIYGAVGEIDLSHIEDHVTRARAHLQEWIETLHQVVPESEASARAFARMRGNRAPARRGKDSSKDCLIFETYLGAGRALREAGMTAPIVFLSSNTSEYLTESRVLKAEIAEDLDPISMLYAPSAGAAVRALGL
ncbi:hypothetical protein GGQ65_005031 [Rhizobium fabae]|uniref:DUF4935 domain-containing protein n=2 Tax=Rhizobium fabae TaxID=573179 RepID=A0A7W6B8I4_9HYPH|nr:hypothetical protein [Rhizobium fabae]